MSKFIKKPIVVEAIQYTGENKEEIIKFTENKAIEMNNNILMIPTLEGSHLAMPSDWIIRGIKGEYYPCKNDIFVKTYEPLGTDKKPNNVFNKNLIGKAVHISGKTLNRFFNHNFLVFDVTENNISLYDHTGVRYIFYLDSFVNGDLQLKVLE